MHRLSKTSKRRLSTCHKDLQLIIETAIGVSRVDFGVSEGHRTIELQNKYFKEKKSKIDGITRKGKHNYSPSLAADIYPYVNGKALWNNETLTYVAAVIVTVGQMLYNEGKVSHLIRWGGNWDRDGEIIFDQRFDDRPHVELISV